MHTIYLLRRRATMKRKKKLLNKVVGVLCTLVLVVTLAFANGSVSVVMAAEGDIAWDQLSTVFPDELVCDEVKVELIDNGVSSGVVTQADLDNITYLDIRKTSGEINLQGLERLTMLETLKLSGDIQSLAPLNNLTNLRALFLNDVDNAVSFSQMSNVSSINRLNCDGCDGIVSLDGLENNVGMSSVHIRSCKNLNDISACSGYTNLGYIELYSCAALVDISPLAGIQTLTTVDIGNSSITDISPLSGKTSIETLKMPYIEAFTVNPDAACQVLGTLTGVEYLCLRGSNINDAAFEKICNMTHFQANLLVLDLLDNDITDLAPVTSLVNLSVLDIGGNGISDFTPLASLNNLGGYHCCNVADKDQNVVFSGPNRTVENPFVDMNGNIIVPAQSDEFTYNPTDNTITYVGDDWSHNHDFVTVQMNYNGRTFDMALHIRFESIVDTITITTQPEDISVKEDEKITLSVEAESFDEDFDYQWYKGDEMLNGEEGATLTIDEAKLEDAGSYKCVVRNATATATSNVAKVEVKEEVTTQATTQEPTTAEPTTDAPTTAEPTTQAPSTGSTTDVAPEQSTTAAPATTEAANTDAAVTTGDSTNPLIAVMVLLLALMGMVFVRRAYSYKE